MIWNFYMNLKSYTYRYLRIFAVFKPTNFVSRFAPFTIDLESDIFFLIMMLPVYDCFEIESQHSVTVKLFYC